jgi:hypothetical protein
VLHKIQNWQKVAEIKDAVAKNKQALAQYT